MVSGVTPVVTLVAQLIQAQSLVILFLIINRLQQSIRTVPLNGSIRSASVAVERKAGKSEVLWATNVRKIGDGMD
jgi:hypothetical protein